MDSRTDTPIASNDPRFDIAKTKARWRNIKWLRDERPRWHARITHRTYRPTIKTWELAETSNGVAYRYNATTRCLDIVWRGERRRVVREALIELEFCYDDGKHYLSIVIIAGQYLT